MLYTSIETEQHLDHILFGNMLGVGRADLWTAGIISLVVSGFLALKWRDLLLHAFDPAQAQASGLRTGWLHYGLLTVLSLTIVATLSGGLDPCRRAADHAGGHRVPAGAQLRADAGRVRSA